MSNVTYQSALKRNINEVAVAKLEFDAHREIANKVLLNFYDSFFSLSLDALFNDMVAHMIKLLDRNAQSTSFWYIFRYKSKGVKEYIKDNNIDFMAIYDLADKLKLVRDKTLFHIDKKGVKDPQAIWSEADITYGEIEENIDSIFNILNYLYEKEFEYKFEIPKIDNLQYIIKASIEAGYAEGKES